MVPVKSIVWLLVLGLPATALAQTQSPTAPQTLRAEPPPPQLRALFEHCDGDGNAALSWVEFENCWRQLRAGRLRTQAPAANGNNPSPPAAPLPPASQEERDDTARSGHEQ